jgi:hypothetical protein
MAVPVPRTWVASETVTATIMNGINGVRDAHNFLLAPPRVSVYKSANQTLTDATYAVVSFNTELYDPYSTAAHDNATNNSRLIAAETGLYSVNLNLVFAANATSTRRWELRSNAAGSQASGSLVASDIRNAETGGVIGTRMDRTLDVPLTAGDYLEIFARQDSGGSLALVGGNSADTYFQMRWWAKQ